MPARLPDFIGIGTQKGGTTTLHKLLNEHPQVYLPECKEVHYFDLNQDQSINWYKNHFKNARKEECCGEITPFYMYHPEVPQRIKRVLPDIKIIILLRDPVERTISQIYHSRKRGFETLGPQDAIEAEQSRMSTGNIYNIQKHSYVGRSRYLEQLDRYEKYFSRNQMLILKSEDLFLNPGEVWNKILNFLELDITIITILIPKENARKIESTEVTEELRQKLKINLKETALGIRERYGFGWDWA